jgi:AraC-like DNA-binding protein
MLLARGHRRLGSASLRWGLAFTGAGWFQVIESDRIVCDTRVTPGSPEPAKPIVCLELVARGTIHTFGAMSGRYGAPTAVAMRHEHYEGADGRRTFDFRAEGSPCLAVELHTPAKYVALVDLPKTFALSDRAWDVAARAARMSEGDDAVLDESLRALVEALRAEGILTDEGATRALRATPSAMARLWRAVKPTIEHLALAVTAKDLGVASDLSTSQAERAFRRWAAAFALVGPGVRSVARNIRLKTAVLFLSAEDASVASVAEAVGYGSADAMARAFRDAGLAPPTDVRRALLAVDR